MNVAKADCFSARQVDWIQHLRREGAEHRNEIPNQPENHRADWFMPSVRGVLISAGQLPPEGDGPTTASPDQAGWTRTGRLAQPFRVLFSLGSGSPTNSMLRTLRASACSTRSVSIRANGWPTH